MKVELKPYLQKSEELNSSLNNVNLRDNKHLYEKWVITTNVLNVNSHSLSKYVLLKTIDDLLIYLNCENKVKNDYKDLIISQLITLNCEIIKDKTKIMLPSRKSIDNEFISYYYELIIYFYFSSYKICNEFIDWLQSVNLMIKLSQ